MFTPNNKRIKKESLLQECEERTDHAALGFKVRIVLGGHIHTVEESYHPQCHQQFKVHPKVCPSYGTMTNACNLDTIKEAAYLELSYLLSDKKFTLHNIGEKNSNIIPECAPPYLSKHLKRKFTEHFGDSTWISKIEGVSNIITFRHTAANILFDTWNKQMDHDVGSSELDKEIEQVGEIIGHCIY